MIEAATSSSHVDGRALCVHLGAEAFLGVAGAGKVGLGSLIADAGATLGDVMEPLVRAVHRASIAGANSTAIEQVLHCQVDVHTLSFASDFDSVAEGGDGTVRPAGTAVLRDVLVPGHRAVALAVLVAPAELLGHLLCLQEFVGAGFRGVSTPSHSQGLGVGL